MKESDREPMQPQKKGNTPWEKLGLDVVEYARLMKSLEEDIQKQADKIRFERECKKYEKEPPFVFAGLGCIYWILIFAIGFFFAFVLVER